MKEMVHLEYFHHTRDEFVVITIPRSELLDNPEFIVRGISRYGAHVLDAEESAVFESDRTDGSDGL